MYQLLSQILDDHVPLRQKRVRRVSYPWISGFVLELIRQKSYALKCFLRNRCELTWKFFKRARNRATEEIRASKKEYFSSAIKENKDNPKEMWKTLKKLLPFKNAKLPDKVVVAEKHYSSKLEIANCFNDYFSSAASKLTSHLQTPNLNQTDKLTSRILSLPVISTDMVVKVISKLRCSKGTGLDKIPMKMVKSLGKSHAFVNTLTKLINYSFQSGVFPET